MDKNIFYAPPRTAAGGWEEGDRGIDLNEQLVQNKAATFFMRVNSEAMRAAGVEKGDVVIVDRSIEPANGQLVIAAVGKELLIRKLEINNNRKRLTTGGGWLSAIEWDAAHMQLWGVVTFVIHKAT